MDEKYVTMDVHNEFARRMDEANKVLDTRVAALERGLQGVSKMALNIERLTTSVEQMTAELTKYGTRLENLEQKPAKRWDAVVTGIIGAVVGALVGAVLAGAIH